MIKNYQTITTHKRYKQKYCIKYQFTRGRSGLAINGGDPDIIEQEYLHLERKAKEFAESKNFEYFTLDRYYEPCYGIICVNLRVYPDKETFEKHREKQ